MLKNIIEYKGRQITAGLSDDLAIRSVQLTQSVNTGTELTLGSVCAAMLEVEFIGTNGELEISAGDVLTLYKQPEEGEAVQVGRFIAEMPETTGGNSYKVTAYDFVTKLDKDVTQWLASLDAWPYTLLDFARMVCEECGLELVTGGWIPNAYFPVRKFAKSGVTGRKLMRWIGEVCARFVRATADGKIEFAWYAPTGVTIAPTGGNYYFSGSFSKEKYAVAPIDSVHIRFANSEAGYLWPELEDASANIYAISDNPFLSSISEDTSDDVSEALELIRDELEGVTYTPCKVSVPASYGIKAGQIVDILSKDGTAITTYVMKSTTSGQRTSLECTGSARRDSTTAANNKTPTEAAKDVLLGETPQEVFDRLTGMSKDQGIYMEDGKIYINAEYMKTGVLASPDGGVKIDLNNGYGNLARSQTIWLDGYDADAMPVDLEEQLRNYLTAEAQKLFEQVGWTNGRAHDYVFRLGTTTEEAGFPNFGEATMQVFRSPDGVPRAGVSFEWWDGKISHMTGMDEYEDGNWVWSDMKWITGDFIVEQGTSGIWTYRKWNSGKIELWTNSYQFTVSFTKSSIGVYYATQSGIAVPLVKTIEFASGDCTKWHYVNWSSVTCNDGKNLSIRYYGLNANGGGSTIPFSFYVIGTWK